MFQPEVYARRRARLRELVPGGALLLLGHPETPRNYDANAFPFRQNSHFWYFAGHALPDMALLLTEDEELLFGLEPSVDDIVWTGPLPSLAELGAACGVRRVLPRARLEEHLAGPASAGRLHWLRPYHGHQLLQLARLLHRPVAEIEAGASAALALAVTRLRLYKEPAEVQEVEAALEVSYEMYRAAAAAMRPGASEAEVQAALVGAALACGCEQSFLPIVTIHGEVLHNHGYRNRLPAGGLLLVDSGAETGRGYASDITRTFPIDGAFTARQAALYEVVLAGQQAALDAGRPGVTMKELHLTAARRMASGLRELGLMRGDVDEAVAAGAHALFFPHGLGHMLGLDVHDMEDLGDVVGYGPGLARDSQFGLSFLRMARALEPGFCFTIEPGLYFIPALIDAWRAARRHEAYIDYAAVERYRGFGGVRIEDDVLVTDSGLAVLGTRPIPKALAEVERFVAEARA